MKRSTLRLAFIVPVVAALIPMRSQAQSVADLARQSREAKQFTEERTLTNDEVGAPVDPLVSSAQRAATALQDVAALLKEYYDLVDSKDGGKFAEQNAKRLEALGRERLASIVLSRKNLDLPFQGRPDWTMRLYWQNQSYITQLREVSKAIRQYETVAAHVQQPASPADLLRLEEFRKVAEAAVKKANQESFKCLALADEGWSRASYAPSIPQCSSKIRTAPCIRPSRNDR
jgi:hypothetical protein